MDHHVLSASAPPTNLSGVKRKHSEPSLGAAADQAAAADDDKAPPDVPEPDPPIGLTVLPGLDCSILSTLLADYESIGAYEHPLIRFFTMVEACELRAVHDELRVAVASMRYRDVDDPTLFVPHAAATSFTARVSRGGLASWRACFPSAEYLCLPSGEALEELAAVARGGALSALRVLDIVDIDLDDDATADLADALRCMGGLQTLNAGRNFMGAANMRVLAPSLPSLVSIDLSCSRLGPGGAADLAATFPRMRGTLRALKLHSNFLGDGGAVAIAAELACLERLALLDLGVNGISVEGAWILAATLPALKELASLSLHCNAIADTGAVALSAALPALPSLVALDVGYNSIGDAGMSSLALAVPGRLHTLILCRNVFGVEAARVLAGALPSLTKLRTFHMRGIHALRSQSVRGDLIDALALVGCSDTRLDEDEAG